MLNLHFQKTLQRALSMLEPGIGPSAQQQKLNLVGTTSPVALASLLVHETHHQERTPVVVVADEKAAAELAEALHFFSPNLSVFELTGFDVNPYAGLYPSPRLMVQRLGWLNAAITPSTDQVLIAPIEALCQKTLPVAAFSRARKIFRSGVDLPQNPTKWLTQFGYQPVPVVEDVGSFAVRGGVVDIFSPAHARPIRLQLFGDQIEVIRFFDPASQRSEESIPEFCFIPAREVFFESGSEALQRYLSDTSLRQKTETLADVDFVQHNLRQENFFPGIEYLLPFFFESLSSPLDFLSQDRHRLWIQDSVECSRSLDNWLEDLKNEYRSSEGSAIRPQLESLFSTQEGLALDSWAGRVELSNVAFSDSANDSELRFRVQNIIAKSNAANRSADEMATQVAALRAEGARVFVSTHTSVQSKRIGLALEKAGLTPATVSSADWSTWEAEQGKNRELVHLIERPLPENLKFVDDQVAILTEEDFLGRKQRRREVGQSIPEKASTIVVSDLKPSDRVVHILHGIGVYEGLKVMTIEGIDSEYIQIAYKDNDKLYLPIYRISQIHRYSGPQGIVPLDKLGGTQWAKTTGKIKNQLRDLALELLQLYAKRSQLHRPAFLLDRREYDKFSDAFPYDETEDQQRSINDIFKDMTSTRPMDRLVCGDVGFGKTEVAMRAAFHAVQSGKQVVVLCPTTVLCFQHLETFQRRFQGWPVEIRAMNRFISSTDIRKTVEGMKSGSVQVVIGTHRLLSKDIELKNLGLLIIDEEQRFGVAHKERIRKLKNSVDTLTLSATPIPRTLNMSLVGMRDLSLINTPPVDRLPTRTFVCKYDDETIRKAIESEVHRGGQVFFIHNRVQSIYGVADKLRELMPKIRLRVGHGQMEEHELEQTMIAFFKHEIDILLCTTIIESGIDNPQANTMFIDNAHAFGLSQLYQLRGRVGRSKDRAYCYLLIPPDRRIEKDAQERLKVIQENTALGSGIRIAQHDLELRGAGDILGDEQSGQIDAVGYELYLELLEDALREARGEELIESIEPEINIRIPALIPGDYMPDLRLRLSFYKAMGDIHDPSDMDRIEEQLRDQFGPPPEPVFNLMGVMLIRHHCKELGIRDLSSGQKAISLAFTAQTPLPPTEVVKLAQTSAKKFSVTPDMRLIIRLDNINWMSIYEELLGLRKLCR